MQITEETFVGFRHDGLPKFFELSGATDIEEQAHVPYLVFTEETIEVCRDLKKLVNAYDPEAWVVRQWPGKMVSDFFRFQVKDIIAYLDAEAAKAKSAD